MGPKAWFRFRAILKLGAQAVEAGLRLVRAYAEAADLPGQRLSQFVGALHVEPEGL